MILEEALLLMLLRKAFPSPRGPLLQWLPLLNPLDVS